jgi:uncharacterized protein YcfL
MKLLIMLLLLQGCASSPKVEVGQAQIIVEPVMTASKE